MALNTALLVVKSNALIESNYTLTVQEQRIILSAIACIGKDDIVTDQTMYDVRVLDIAKLAGIPVDDLYIEMKEAAIKLKQRTVFIVNEPNGGKKRSSALITGWVQSIQYIDKEARLEIRFCHDILPYINQLSSHFTKYKLAEAARLKTQYGFRLFELIMQWQGNGSREIGVSDLKHALQLTTEYERITNLKKWVIEPAVADINANTNMLVKWEQQKVGRSIVAFQFIFCPKEHPQDLQTKPKKKNRPSRARKGPRLSEALQRLANLNNDMLQPEPYVPEPESFMDRIHRLSGGKFS